MAEQIENNELKKFFDQHDKPSHFTFKKVSSASDIVKKSLLPYLPIKGFEVPYTDMYKEAEKLIPMMVSHRNEYEEHKSWKSLCIHGLSATQTQGAEKYGLDPDDKSIYGWTEICDRIPVTKEFFEKTFKYEWYQRIRLMYLGPGGYINPHSDVDYYMLGSVNIALNNPEGCKFVMKDKGEVPFYPGAVNKLALINEHAVWNKSEQPRIHIIVHGSPDWRHWNPIYEKSYENFVKELENSNSGSPTSS